MSAVYPVKDAGNWPRYCCGDEDRRPVHVVHDLVGDLALGEHAAEAVHDLRSLLAALRLVRTTAIQTAVWMIVAGVLMVLAAGLSIRLKLSDGGSWEPASPDTHYHFRSIVHPRAEVQL